MKPAACATASVSLSPKQEHWSERVFGGLKGGLTLASNLDLSPALGLAASFLGAGAGALAREQKTNVVIEIEIEAGAQGAIVALAPPGLAALMLHDRETCRRALARGSAGADESAAPEDLAADGLIDRSRRALPTPSTHCQASMVCGPAPASRRLDQAPPVSDLPLAPNHAPGGALAPSIPDN